MTHDQSRTFRTELLKHLLDHNLKHGVQAPATELVISVAGSLVNERLVDIPNAYILSRAVLAAWRTGYLKRET